MKKNNTKGFVLAEVIIISVVVISALTAIYMQFISVNNSYYRSFRYNTVDDLYALNNIRDFIENDNFDNIIYSLKGNNYIDLTNCSEIFIEYNYCKVLLNTLNVKKIIFTYESVSNLKNDLNNTDFSEGLKSFIKTINANKNDKYRLIAEFENDRYATLKIGELNYEITNMISNGSFENDFMGWNSNYDNAGGVTLSTEVSSTGKKSIYVSAVGDSKEKAAAYKNEISLKSDHKYYFSVDYYLESFVKGNKTLASFVKPDVTNAIHFSFESDKLNTWLKVNEIFTANEDMNYNDIRFGHVYAEDSTFSLYMDSIILIDLTESFGFGNEPTEQWCNENIKWFDGTIKINYDNLAI